MQNIVTPMELAWSGRNVPVPVQDTLRQRQPPQPPFIFTYGIGQQYQTPMYPVAGQVEAVSSVFHQPTFLYNRARIWTQNSPTSWRPQ